MTLRGQADLEYAYGGESRWTDCTLASQDSNRAIGGEYRGVARSCLPSIGIKITNSYRARIFLGGEIGYGLKSAIAIS